ncbi:hypothetical protein VTK56DRAFT_8797 [Thermocarpiscus australiensis]
MTPEFEARLQKAIDDGILPGAVLLARDKSGKINYTAALGHATLDPSQSPSPAMTPSTVFTLASMTKLLTAIAALQLVDRGLLTLDTDVAPYLPALAAQPILTGFDPDPSTGGSPILVPRTRPILLRHLLTHSAGTAYFFTDRSLAAYFRRTGRPMPPGTGVGRTVEERFGYPLLAEPGQGWRYGSAMDWVGRLVEVVTGVGLEEYFVANILAPVGVEKGGITFFPGRYPGVVERMAGMSARDEKTGRVVHHEMEIMRLQEGRQPLGGQGAYAALDEYMKVVYSLLVDDGKLLSPQTARLLFEPLLREPEAKKALLENLEDPAWIVGSVPVTREYDWSAGGLLVDGDSHPYRKRGCVFWSGVFNLTWFIDRTAGVCGVFGTQILQAADPLVRPLMKEFEEAIYSKL